MELPLLNEMKEVLAGQGGIDGEKLKEVMEKVDTLHKGRGRAQSAWIPELAPEKNLGGYGYEACCSSRA